MEKRTAKVLYIVVLGALLLGDAMGARVRRPNKILVRVASQSSHGSDAAAKGSSRYTFVDYGGDDGFVDVLPSERVVPSGPNQMQPSFKTDQNLGSYLP